MLEYEVKPLIKEFLRVRGLELSEEKTLITHINDGFDFLGVNVRMYDGKLLTKPSKKNYETIIKKIRNIIKDNPSMKQELLIRKLNPIIRGWVNFQKFNVSAKAFEKLDYEIWQSLWSWCKRRHPKKGRRWVAKKYFHTIGNRTWSFSVPTRDKMENGEDFFIRLIYATNTDIKRFTKIKAAANAFDQEWEDYFVEREEKLMRNEIKGRRIISGLWNEQKGHCAYCNGKITLETDFRIYLYVWDNAALYLIITPVYIGTSYYDFMEGDAGWIKSNGTCLSYQSLWNTYTCSLDNRKCWADKLTLKSYLIMRGGESIFWLSLP